LLNVTDAINKAFVVSGATAQEASNAAIQLSQGLAAGALRGEELNSVMEQGPRITRALADYLGVTNGQIRAMAAEGKITAEVVTNALLRSLSSLNEELDRMPRRFEQASTALKNNFLAAVGQVDIDPLISSVDALATSLADPKVIDGIQSIATGIGQVVAVGGAGLKTVVSNTDALMAITGAYAVKVGVGLANSLFVSAKARLVDLAATNQQIIASKQAEVASAAEAVAMQSVVVSSTEAALARAYYARAEAIATSQSELNSIRQLKAVTAQLAADRSLEIQRQKAQINNIGLAASHTRLAEIRTAEVAITSQLAAAEARLAVSRQAELATGAIVGQQTAALNAARTEGAGILAAQTAAQNALNAAESRGAATRGAALAALGGPLGLVTLGLAAAAGYIYFSSSADSGTQSLIEQNLTLDETVDKFDQLTAAQQRNQASKWAEAQKSALDDAASSARKYANIAQGALTSSGAARVEDMRALSAMIAEVGSGKKTLDDVTVWLQSTQSLAGGFKTSLEEIAAGYDSSLQSAAAYGDRINAVATASNQAAGSTDRLAAAQSKAGDNQKVSAAAWDKYIEQLTKARDLIGANAAAEAEYTARKMGA
ncbi:tape measure protein, partial [Pseudomonas lundensis]